LVAWTALGSRVAAACRRVGRDPRELTVIAVTKTFPATDVLALASLGARHIGENRDQEASAKRAQVAQAQAAHAQAAHAEATQAPAAQEPSGPDGSAAPLTWHAIGQIQRNKARSIVQWADMVHSIDSIRLATALATAAAAARPQPLPCLIQVSLDGDARRGGAPAEHVEDLAAHIEQSPGLTLRGVMAVAPLAVDPGEAFARLAGVAARVRAQHPDATVISAGMSADLEQAIGYGATHLRVGGAILGNRPPTP
jgi:uncharacterized pyridoxal phosphate-containing UPF0001 family protein